MKFIKYCIGILTVLSNLTFPLTMSGQGIDDNTAYYNWFDQAVGRTSSGLFYGLFYQERYRVINQKHKFFLKPNFHIGNVTYAGELYFDLELKYDVFDDEILVRHSGMEGSPIIQMIKENVSDFSIDGHYFENLKSKETEPDVTLGFYEVLLKTNTLSLYKKHTKKILKRSSSSSVYYEFKDNHQYFIMYGGDIQRVKSDKDITSVFPEFRKQLKFIYEEHKNMKKSFFENYLQLVLRDLENIIFENSAIK